VIVRIMGEGQFEIDEEVAKGLNDLDQQADGTQVSVVTVRQPGFICNPAK